MFNSFEQIKWGGGSEGRGGGYWNFCFPFQPLCSLTPVQFYILPARLTHTHAGKKNAHNSRNLHFTLHHACERTSKGSTYRLPHCYEHGQKTIVCFFLNFFFCVLFLHFIWPAFNWHLSREIFWYNASAFVCTVRVQSLDSLPLRTQTQIRIGATSQPRKSTFPPFSSYLSKEGGGRDWDIETHRTDSKYTQNTAMMESTGCRNGFYSLVAAPYKMLLSLKHQWRNIWGGGRSRRRYTCADHS